MTTELKYKITQVNSFIDEAFDVKHLSDFHLIIQIGNDGLIAAVYDKDKSKYIAFEYYSFQQTYSSDIVTGLLELAIEKSRIIDHRYRTAVCSVINNLSTIIPSALYDEEKRKTYLAFNTSLQGDEIILADSISNLEAKNVFAVPAGLKAKLGGMFNKVVYHHFSSGLIENILIQNKNQTQKKLFVHVQASHFEAVVIEGKRLLFYNSFNHHSAEDFIYYLLFVCEQLHLNTESIETVLIGEIERTSAIYTIIQKYIRVIKFGSRPEAAYSYQLQTFPAHFYFSLFNNFLLQ